MPKLTLTMPPESATRQINLVDFIDQEIRIGRASTNEIVLDDGRVSRFHAIIRIEGPFATITDLDSSNGVKVNGIKVQSRSLEPGDLITIGDMEIRCRSS